MASHTAGLGEELSKHITSLEGALAVIAATKRHLANNASQAKSRIHSMMSRQLESLRSREVWLLSQVELLHDTKDSVLREQAESLRQALGALQSCRQYMEETGEPGEVEASIQETIDRLSKLELDPLENRNLSFKADLAKMRDAIHNFGRVDSHMTAMDLGFHGNSRSLPRAFEEYEDEDTEHLMYKTVQDVTTSGGCTHRMINVTVPKLKAKPSDWLFLPTDVQPPVSHKKTSATLPLFKSDLNDWLLRKQDSGASKASVQQWLQELQTQSDLEEDEIMGALNAGTSASSIEVLSLPSQTPSTTTTVTVPDNKQSSYFEKLAAAPREKWLKTAPTTATTSSTEYVTMKYFAEVAHSSDNWLLQRQDSGCCKGSSVSLCPPVSPDIEDLNMISCTQPEKQQDEEKDVDEREVAVLNHIDQLCRANETCHTFTDCVCDDNCQAGDQQASTIKPWLARPSASDSAAPVFDYFSMVAGSKADEWLKPSSGSAMEEMDGESLYPPFHERSSMSSWLLGGQQSPPSTASTTTCPFIRHRSSHTSEWISTTSSSMTPPVDNSHPAFRPSTSTTSMSTNQWLAASPSKPATKVNPWLANSSTASSSAETTASSVSTDQLKAYLEHVNPHYQWSLTKSKVDEENTTGSKKGDDKPVPKKLELPESDNKYAESSKWLLVTKDDEESVLETKEIAMEQENVDVLPCFAKNKSALGEWLMSIHSDF